MSFTRSQKAYRFYLKHEGAISALSFICGFLFDVTFLSRVDDLFAIIQQAVYITIITIIFIFQTWDEEWMHQRTPSWFHKIWGYRDALVHFCLGTLLNVYTLFFFKSSSLASSIGFMIVVAALIVANELPQLRRYGARFQSVLLTLCLLGFWTILVPLILGFIGLFPFLVSVSISAIFIYGVFAHLRRCGHESRRLEKDVLLPATGVLIFYTAFYFLGWIPPVPLALQKSGIYHDIKKIDGNYELFTEKPSWKFWQNGDQDFYARPGDKIYFYARIFAPTRIKDQIKVRWMYKDARLGWQSADAIPMNIAGGREEGYRGYAYKANYMPGSWRVQVESSDGREIGRLHFQVIPETDETGERRFTSEKD
jgi:hypothetical protein